MYEYRARCTKVVDGDTYDFEVDLGFYIVHKIRVRLKDVDTPELRARSEEQRKHAQEATVFAAEHLLGAESPWVTIRTEKDKIGIYGRYTATVTFDDGRDLGSMLKEAGFEKKAEYPA
jgi:micrococcal nuclease